MQSKNITLNVLIKSIQQDSERLTYKLLKQACLDAGVELKNIELDKTSVDTFSGSMVRPGDAFLRLAVGREASLAESLIVRKDISSIYDDWRLPVLSGLWDDSLLLHHSDVPIIPTAFLVANLEAAQIDNVVQQLGGYPVIAKISGLSHGQGVHLCRDLQQVQEILYKRRNQAAGIALRRYLESPRHLRAVVVGDEVVDVIEYDLPEDDFRTNAVKTPTARPVEASSEVKHLAAAAAKAIGVRFCGVDILVDRAGGELFVAESNTPCNYGRNYLTNGKNIAVDIVKMLTKKH